MFTLNNIISVFIGMIIGSLILKIFKAIDWVNLYWYLCGGLAIIISLWVYSFFKP